MVRGARPAECDCKACFGRTLFQADSPFEREIPRRRSGPFQARSPPGVMGAKTGLNRIGAVERQSCRVAPQAPFRGAARPSIRTLSNCGMILAVAPAIRAP